LSLYGSGRWEGICAVVLIAVLVLVVHAVGSFQVFGFEADFLRSTWMAAVPAIAGMTCYRLLRAQRRSRFAAFLGGLAYAWSPWLVAMALAPREQLAVALAPMSLEAAFRCAHPSMRSVWLPWAGLCLALPFAAGASVVAMLAAVLAIASFWHTVAHGDQTDEKPPVAGMLLAALCGTLAAVSLAWLDLLGPLFGPATTLTSAEVLSAYRPGAPTLDAASFLRVPGPLLIVFAVLGLMRRQRHVRARFWCYMAVLGAVPTGITMLPWTPDWWDSALATAPMLPASSWWLTLLGITVLGTAGLDDFLDLPLRRRTALAWLFALTVLISPLVPTFGSVAPTLEWPITGTFLLMALLLNTWRRLGILGFKRLLAIAAVLVLAIPLLQVLPVPPVPVENVPDSEGLPALYFGPLLLAHPFWHYSGLLAVVAGSCLVAMYAFFLRKRHARAMPTPAKAAIKKKTRPAQLS
jgi:hypothetical protein